MNFKNFKTILTRHTHVPVSKQNTIIETMHEYYEPAEKPARFKFSKRMIFSALTAFVFLGLVSFASVLEFTPTESLTLDINPGFEIQLNRYGRVVNVEAYGEDAIAIVKDLKLGSRSPEVVINNLVNDCIESGIDINSSSIVMISLSNQANTDLKTTIEQWFVQSNLTLFYVTPGSLMQETLVIVNNNDVNYFIKSTSGLIEYTVSSSRTESTSGALNNNESYDIPAANSDAFLDEQLVQGYFLIDADDLETASIVLDITEARLQLIIAVFNAYEEFNTKAEFQALVEMPLNALIEQYEAIPE